MLARSTLQTSHVQARYHLCHSTNHISDGWIKTWHFTSQITPRNGIKTLRGFFLSKPPLLTYDWRSVFLSGFFSFGVTRYFFNCAESRRRAASLQVVKLALGVNQDTAAPRPPGFSFEPNRCHLLKWLAGVSPLLAAGLLHTSGRRVKGQFHWKTSCVGIS